jgi:hypothetical protein
MPGNPRDMIVSAERRFPVRIRIGVPPDGFGRFGQRYAQITAWLGENCGADGWVMTCSSLRSVDRGDCATALAARRSHLIIPDRLCHPDPSRCTGRSAGFHVRWHLLGSL